MDPERLLVNSDREACSLRTGQAYILLDNERVTGDSLNLEPSFGQERYGLGVGL